MRHTLSDAYEQSQALLMAQATRPHAEPTSDVEVTRNAKGDWQFKVAVTMHDPNEAYRKACELAESLAHKFPFVNGAEPEENPKRTMTPRQIAGKVASQK